MDQRAPCYTKFGLSTLSNNGATQQDFWSAVLGGLPT